MERVVEFDKASKLHLFALFGKASDAEGYVIDSTNGERVLTRDGEEIRLNELVGYKKGSEIFIKNDITSLIDYVGD